jgi:hypothetical protein
MNRAHSALRGTNAAADSLPRTDTDEHGIAGRAPVEGRRSEGARAQITSTGLMYLAREVLVICARVPSGRASRGATGVMLRGETPSAWRFVCVRGLIDPYPSA